VILPPSSSRNCRADSCIGPSDSTAMGWTRNWVPRWTYLAVLRSAAVSAGLPLVDVWTYITPKNRKKSKIHKLTYDYVLILKPGVSARRKLMSWCNSPVTSNQSPLAQLSQGGLYTSIETSLAQLRLVYRSLTAGREVTLQWALRRRPIAAAAAAAACLSLGWLGSAGGSTPVWREQ